MPEHTAFQAALQAAEAVATPGPWLLRGSTIIVDPNGVMGCDTEIAHGIDPAVGRLIVLLRNAVPELIELVRAAREALDSFAPEVLDPCGEDRMDELLTLHLALAALNTQVAK